MERTLGVVFFRFAVILDSIRSRLLRVTLSVPTFRFLFVARARRLAFLFVLSFSICFFLSLSFPLWVLALGPALYGVPHLFSSVRYFHYAIGPEMNSDSRMNKKGLLLIAVLMAVVLTYRLIVNVNLLDIQLTPLSEWSGSIYLELFALLITFFIGAFIYQISWRRLHIGILLLLPLVGAFWLDPFSTIGALVLIHNFVAFAYWYRGSTTTAEKCISGIAGLMVLLTTVFIFGGALDPLIAWLRPMEELPFANMNVEQMGGLIAPRVSSSKVGLHAAIAYAFGQSMHYFVWLKAIPDQYHHNEIPTSFRQSLQLLGRDFGRASTIWIPILVLLTLMTWVFLEFAKMRMIYFALAAYHGYLEIGGLLLAASQKKSLLVDHK